MWGGMRFAYLAIALLALSACAAIHRQEAADSEALLKQAGFQARAADGPERQQDLVKMPSRQIVERDQNGTAVYTFADPDNCRCLYVGRQKMIDDCEQNFGSEIDCIREVDTELRAEALQSGGRVIHLRPAR